MSICEAAKSSPRPSSISSLPKWKDGPDPGKLQGAKLTPIVPSNGEKKKK